MWNRLFCGGAGVTQQFDIAKAQHTRGDVLDLMRVMGGAQ